MPSPRTRAKTKRRRIRVKAARRPARSDLLIVECDAHRLAADSLNLGSVFARLVTSLFPDKKVAIVRTSSEQELGKDLAEVLKAHGRFRSIVMVGHSNETGLALTGDGLRSWEAVGYWLRIFEPEFCFLAACKAGKSVAVGNLFKAIPTLKQIYASPAVLYKTQTSGLGLLIMLLLQQGRIHDDQSEIARVLSYALHGGQIYRWKRRETGPGEELKARLLDSVAALLDHGPWDLLEAIFPARPSPGANLRREPEVHFESSRTGPRSRSY